MRFKIGGALWGLSLSAMAGTLELNVPQDSEVFLEGYRMFQTGEKRVFTFSDENLLPGLNYMYRVTVRKHTGEEQNWKVLVQAGKVSKASLFPGAPSKKPESSNSNVEERSEKKRVPSGVGYWNGGWNDDTVSENAGAKDYYHSSGRGGLGAGGGGHGAGGGGHGSGGGGHGGGGGGHGSGGRR